MYYMVDSPLGTFQFDSIFELQFTISIALLMVLYVLILELRVQGDRNED